ncbi:MAG TPA: hypothetical protein DDW52_10980 [Planctomycetaceae bacterium]|nr:hypothetical protein [Planctomycetaceae bacterium]
MSTERSPAFEPAGTANRIVIYFGVFMLVGLFALAWIGREPPVSANGEDLPILDLQPLVAADPVNNEMLTGKITVLHFWGTWCPPCIKEFPEFVELHKEFRDNRDVAFISVSCTSGAELDLETLKRNTQAFLQEQGATIPTYADGTAKTRTRLLMLLGGSFGLPTTLVVDRDGVIVHTMAGYYPGEMSALSDKLHDLVGS